MSKIIQYVVLIWSLVFAPSTIYGIWWNVSVHEKQKELQDYGEQYGEYLRKNPLFPGVPQVGAIRWYHVLNVDENATREAVKTQRNKLALATHTDKGIQEKGELIKAVNSAMDEFNADAEYVMIWNGDFVSRFGNFDQHGPGIVPPIDSLTDFFLKGGENKKASKVDDTLFMEKFNALTRDWQRFYAVKFTVLAGLAYGYHYLTKLAESDKDSWLKKNKKIQQFIAWWSRFKKEHTITATILTGSGRAGFIALAGIYPFYRFRNFFSWGSLKDSYRSETTNDVRISKDDLKVFYREIKVRTIHYTDGSTSSIYEPSFPIGYMTAEQERKEFMPIRKSEVMGALTVAASLVATWVGITC